MSNHLQELIAEIDKINGGEIGLAIDALNDLIEFQNEDASPIVQCAVYRLQHAKNAIEGLCNVAETLKHTD